MRAVGVSRGWMAVVVLWAMLAPAWSAQAAFSAKLCREACVERIAACVASAQRARCARRTLRRCRREGLSACQRTEVLEAMNHPSDNLVPPDLLTAAARSSNEIDLSWTDSNTRDT